MRLKTRINSLQWGHFRTKALYRMFWFAVYFKFTGIARFMGDTSACFGRGSGYLSIGEDYPNDILWDEGYRVRCAGYVLGERILVYEAQRPIFSLEPQVKPIGLLAENV